MCDDMIEIMAVKYPSGCVVRKVGRDNIAWYLNQSAGDWSANGTVYLDWMTADKALTAKRAGKFKRYKTSKIAKGSD